MGKTMIIANIKPFLQSLPVHNYVIRKLHKDSIDQ
jgi:hypothetical protein